MNEAVTACDLSKVSLFIMNEDEGMQITGMVAADDILAAMGRMYPNARSLLTLGAKGSIYQENGRTLFQDAFHVKAVDTTAAGDTFTGYFLAAMARGNDIPTCLRLASKAAALTVAQKGAASSIPYLQDVLNAAI